MLPRKTRQCVTCEEKAKSSDGAPALKKEGLQAQSGNIYGYRTTSQNSTSIGRLKRIQHTPVEKIQQNLVPQDPQQSTDPKVVRVLETSLQLNKGSFEESLVAVQQVLWADASEVES